MSQFSVAYVCVWMVFAVIGFLFNVDIFLLWTGDFIMKWMMLLTHEDQFPWNFIIAKKKGSFM